MGIVAKDGGGISPVPEGLFQAVCWAVYDLGTQFSEKWNKTARQALIIWEIPEERIEVEKDEKKVDLPRVVSKRYTLSLGDRALLRKDLESWRGKKFLPEELSGFDITKLVGVNCMIQIIHTIRDGKTYANISSIVPLVKGMEKLLPENKTRIFSMADGDSIPEDTPQWIIDLIKSSAEYKGRGDDAEGGVPF